MAVTAADVALWGKFNAPTGAELALLERVLAAVLEHIETNYITADPFTDTQELALILQVARLWRRRDTPEGIAAFADVQALRIDSLDRDVAMMLEPLFRFA